MYSKEHKSTPLPHRGEQLPVHDVSPYAFLGQTATSDGTEAIIAAVLDTNYQRIADYAGYPAVQATIRQEIIDEALVVRAAEEILDNQPTTAIDLTTQQIDA